MGGPLVKGLLGRLLGYGCLVLGFWLLFRGFLGPHFILAILGGAVILGGMYLIVAARRSDPALPAAQFRDKEEDNPGAFLDGGNYSNKLPP